MLYEKILHMWDKSVKYASPNTEGFCGIFVRIPQNQKGYLVYESHRRKIIYLYDVVFDDIFCSALRYTSHLYVEAMYMRLAMSYITYATSSREQTGDIIKLV